METQNNDKVVDQTQKPPMETSISSDVNHDASNDQDAKNSQGNGIEEKLAEASRKIKELEEKIAKQASTSDVVNAIQTAIAPKQQQISEDEILADMVITNPSEFIKKMEERLERKMTKAKQEEGIQNEFWTSFYKEHPHLNNHKGLVNSVMNANLVRLKDLPAKEAASIIAGEATNIYRGILGESGNEQKMPSGNSSVLPSSSSSSNTNVSKQSNKSVSFAEEIKMFQGKGK